MSLEELWAQLESSSAQTAEGGVVIRRIDPQSADNLFIGVRHPDMTRLLLMQISANPKIADGSLIQSRGFKTELKHFSADAPGIVRLFIESTHRTFNEVFTMVAGDVVEQVISRASTVSGSAAFLGRLERWKRFFDSAGPTGLGDEAIQGLLAELLFLRDFGLRDCQDPMEAVSAWVGPEPLSKDFQYPACSIEVKCSAAREHSKVRISSEIQLDATGLPALFLLVVLVERVAANGLSLPQLVAELRTRLTESAAGRLFEERLLSCGYHDLHQAQYAERQFLVRQQRTFRVGEGFPRISPPLPSGVGDVSYSIALSACHPYEVPLDEIHTLLRT